MTKRVFLGGTTNNSTWREELIPLLDKTKIDYFNPVVEDWTPECQEEEMWERKSCDYLLYVITKEMLGFYSIFEVVDYSNKCPERTIFCYFEEGFNEYQIKSLHATAKLVKNNGAQVFLSLEGVVEFFYKNLKNINYRDIYPNSGKLKNINYRDIYPNSGKYLKNSIEKYKKYKVELPTKLYDLDKKKVNWFSEGSKGNYAILSHSVKNTNNQGMAFLKKAFDLLKTKINYIWVDQLCIDQENSDEVKREMQKMSKYYGKATVTLVAVYETLGDHDSLKPRDIIQKIRESRWFSRAWTFQEGWLSKRTLFMFDDDYLIDGTWLAQYYDFSSETSDIKRATPIGWIYYEDGYEPNDDYDKLASAISLTKVLEEVTKERKVSIPKDIIYSVLGLFPFGEEVNFKYTPRLCGACEGEEIARKCHKKEYKDHNPYYSWEKLEKGLEEIWEICQDYKNYNKYLSEKEKCSKIIQNWWKETKDKCQIAREIRIVELMINFREKESKWVNINQEKQRIKQLKEEAEKVSNNDYQKINQLKQKINQLKQSLQTQFVNQQLQKTNIR